MANFNLTITNEGAAFLADVIANQGSLEFTEVRFSSTNYVGSEASLTEGTFAGTFITKAPSASILNQTTIDIAASFDNTTFTAAKQLYSIGVIAEDGNNNSALVAVCTTSVPDIIPAYMAPGSNYAFNINMTVSSTNGITVTGSVAGVLYVSDIVDNLNSHETNKPLSANQGRLLKELIPTSGMFPHVIVISDAGSVVTLTKEAKVITATETSTGHFEADVDEYGTWTIDSLLNGDDAQTTLNVDAVKIYTITDEHFSASITISYPSGGTCTLSATGQNPQVATSSPYTFTVHAAATYTLTATYRGATRTKNVVISTNGQIETETFLVDGATVLTTDDPEIWLDCICYWDKNYTTEAEIIADSETLLALISDQNAADYMVRSTSFRTLICADALAMLYIGQYNYCADALLANSTWLAAICASDYFELVLSVQNPVMTSNTTPSGTCFGSSYYNAAHDYYCGFNNDYEDSWYTASGTSQTGAYLGYQFMSNTSAFLVSAHYTNKGYATKLKLQGSNDGITWTDLSSVYTLSYPVYREKLYMECTQEYLYAYYRIYITEGVNLSASDTPGIQIFDVKIFGRTDVTPPASRTLKTFATATDAEVLEMVCKADRGEVDLYDDAGWRVGQEHSVDLNPIDVAGTYKSITWSVGERQAAQTATFVLMHKGLYELVTSVLDKQGQTRTTCSFVVGVKNNLSAQGYINSTATNSGSWNSCARRSWCNGGFREAIPSTLRAAFKQFKTITASEPASSSNTISNDYFALPAEKEVLGIKNGGTQTEADALTQFKYYETAANRIKTMGDSGSAEKYWLRTPYGNNTSNMCMMETGATDYGSGNDSDHGISPFGCL